MLKSTNGKTLVAMLVIALIVITTAIAVSRTETQIAQAPPQPQPGPGGYSGQPAGPPPGQPGPGGMMGGGGMRPGMMGGMGAMDSGMMAPHMVAVTASGDYVYVVQGNMLYQYNAKTLKLANKAPIPVATPAPPAGGEGTPQGNG